MLYDRPSILYADDPSSAHRPAMHIPTTRGVYQGCALSAMFFAILASRVYPDQFSYNNGRFGSGLRYPFSYNVRRSRARGYPRRNSDGADEG
jgi:hypothetical protein